MRTLTIVECKKCEQQFIPEGIMSIAAGAKVSIILKSIARCSECQEKLDRSAGGNNRRLGPDTKFSP